jgi:hypothetical protein
LSNNLFWYLNLLFGLDALIRAIDDETLQAPDWRLPFDVLVKSTLLVNTCFTSASLTSLSLSSLFSFIVTSVFSFSACILFIVLGARLFDELRDLARNSGTAAGYGGAGQSKLSILAGLSGFGT